MLRRPKSNRALGDGRIKGDETLRGQCTPVESSSSQLYICCHQIKNTKFLFLYVLSLRSAQVPARLAHALVPPLPALENKSLRKFVAPKYRLLVIKRFIWVGRTRQSVKQERRSGEQYDLLFQVGAEFTVRVTDNSTCTRRKELGL